MLGCTEFLESLRTAASSSDWTILNNSIRCSMVIDGFHADTITFLANHVKGNSCWSPAQFLSAANFLQLPSTLALQIAQANDGHDSYLRELLLDAVGISYSVERN